MEAELRAAEVLWTERLAAEGHGVLLDAIMDRTYGFLSRFVALTVVVQLPVSGELIVVLEEIGKASMEIEIKRKAAFALGDAAALDVSILERVLGNLRHSQGDQRLFYVSVLGAILEFTEEPPGCSAADSKAVGVVRDLIRDCPIFVEVVNCVLESEARDEVLAKIYRALTWMPLDGLTALHLEDLASSHNGLSCLASLAKRKMSPDLKIGFLGHIWEQIKDKIPENSAQLSFAVGSVIEGVAKVMTDLKWESIDVARNCYNLGREIIISTLFWRILADSRAEDTGLPCIEGLNLLLKKIAALLAGCPPADSSLGVVETRGGVGGSRHHTKYKSFAHVPGEDRRSYAGTACQYPKAHPMHEAVADSVRRGIGVSFEVWREGITTILLLLFVLGSNSTDIPTDTLLEAMSHCYSILAEYEGPWSLLAVFGCRNLPADMKFVQVAMSSVTCADNPDMRVAFAKIAVTHYRDWTLLPAIGVPALLRSFIEFFLEHRPSLEALACYCQVLGKLLTLSMSSEERRQVVSRGLIVMRPYILPSTARPCVGFILKAAKCYPESLDDVSILSIPMLQMPDGQTFLSGTELQDRSDLYEALGRSVARFDPGARLAQLMETLQRNIPLESLLGQELNAVVENNISAAIRVTISLLKPIAGQMSTSDRLQNELLNRLETFCGTIVNRPWSQSTHAAVASFLSDLGANVSIDRQLVMARALSHGCIQAAAGANPPDGLTELLPGSIRMMGCILNLRGVASLGPILNGPLEAMVQEVMGLIGPLRIPAIEASFAVIGKVFSAPPKSSESEQEAWSDVFRTHCPLMPATWSLLTNTDHRFDRALLEAIRRRMEVGGPNIDWLFRGNEAYQIAKDALVYSITGLGLSFDEARSHRDAFSVALTILCLPQNSRRSMLKSVAQSSRRRTAEALLGWSQLSKELSALLFTEVINGSGKQCSLNDAEVLVKTLAEADDSHSRSEKGAWSIWSIAMKS